MRPGSAAPARHSAEQRQRPIRWPTPDALVVALFVVLMMICAALGGLALGAA